MSFDFGGNSNNAPDPNSPRVVDLGNGYSIIYGGGAPQIVKNVADPSGAQQFAPEHLGAAQIGAQTSAAQLAEMIRQFNENFGYNKARGDQQQRVSEAGVSGMFNGQPTENARQFNVTKALDYYNQLSQLASNPRNFVQTFFQSRGQVAPAGSEQYGNVNALQRGNPALGGAGLGSAIAPAGAPSSVGPSAVPGQQFTNGLPTGTTPGGNANQPSSMLPSSGLRDPNSINAVGGSSNLTGPVQTIGYNPTAQAAARTAGVSYAYSGAPVNPNAGTNIPFVPNGGTWTPPPGFYDETMRQRAAQREDEGNAMADAARPASNSGPVPLPVGGPLPGQFNGEQRPFPGGPVQGLPREMPRQRPSPYSGAEAPPGRETFSDMAYARGGVVPEPVIGIGVHSGKKYVFGENGPEGVVPANILPKFLRQRHGQMSGPQHNYAVGGVIGDDPYGGGTYPPATYSGYDNAAATYPDAGGGYLPSASPVPGSGTTTPSGTAPSMGDQTIPPGYQSLTPQQVAELTSGATAGGGSYGATTPATTTPATTPVSSPLPSSGGSPAPAPSTTAPVLAPTETAPPPAPAPTPTAAPPPINQPLELPQLSNDWNRKATPGGQTGYWTTDPTTGQQVFVPSDGTGHDMPRDASAPGTFGNVSGNRPSFLPGEDQQDSVLQRLLAQGALPPFLSRLFAQQHGIQSQGTNQPQDMNLPNDVPLVSSMAFEQMTPDEQQALLSYVSSYGVTPETYLALIKAYAPQGPRTSLPSFGTHFTYNRP